MIPPMRNCCREGVWLVVTTFGIRRMCESCHRQRGPAVGRAVVKLKSFEREYMRSIA